MRKSETANGRDGDRAILILPLYHAGGAWIAPDRTTEARIFNARACNRPFAVSPLRRFALRLLAISDVALRQQADHFSDGVFQAYKKRTRNDGVADVELVPPFYI